jgi:DNA-binding response OmpR family regulator
LIVEDDCNLSRSLEQGFREAGFRVMLAQSLAEARDAWARQKPEVLVLDLGLPDGDGFELLAEWQLLADAPPALITTARGELDARLRGLEGGADDYLVKPYAFAELLARVRVLLRRRRTDSGNVMRVADLVLDPVARKASRGGRALELTPNEYGVLIQLVMAQGEVVTRERLAREVWGLKSWTTSMDNVIDVHLSRLRTKVDPKGEPALIVTVRGVGFSLREGS